MLSLSVYVKHDLPAKEAMKRLVGLVHDFEKFKGVLGELRTASSRDGMAFNYTLVGRSATGSIRVRDRHAQLDMWLPWPMVVFKGRLQVIITEAARKLFGTHAK